MTNQAGGWIIGAIIAVAVIAFLNQKKVEAKAGARGLLGATKAPGHKCFCEHKGKTYKMDCPNGKTCSECCQGIWSPR